MMEQVMEDEIAISLNGISKYFRRYNRPIDRLKELLLPGRSRAEEFCALQDVDLQVRRGETLGIIGQNGSGKSTLLQIIAGTLQPTVGSVLVRGRVSALLELGSGFNPEFTGRQNVFFNARILGLSPEEIEEKFDDIAAFAEIGSFIDQPVKTYSSGMFVRLAFAVAIHVNPEVLIVDEALAVGDGIFVHRCMAKIKDFQDAGGTILFVSHDMGSITRLCSRVTWIKAGSLVATGDPSDITRSYQAWVYDQINARHKIEIETAQLTYQTAGFQPIHKTQLLTHNQINPFSGEPFLAFPKTKRFGTGRAEIRGCQVLNRDGVETGLVYPGEWVTIQVSIFAHDDIQQPFVGVSLFDRLRVAIAGINTYQYRYEIPALSSGATLDLKFCIKWPEIQGGSYVLEPAVADGTQDNHEMLDWLQLLLNIESSATNLTFGMMRFPEIKILHHISSSIPGNLP